MNDRCLEDAELQSAGIDEEIARIKAEIDDKYYQLGKTVCEIADEDALRIGTLVDRLVELKKEQKERNDEL